MIFDPSLLFHFVVLRFENEITEFVVCHNKSILSLCILNAVGVIVVLRWSLHNEAFGCQRIEQCNIVWHLGSLVLFDIHVA